MKKHLPGWSDQQRKKAEQQRRMWQDFFSTSEQHETEPVAGLSGDESEGELSAVMARHENELLAYPNVVAVAPGVRTVKGKVTGEYCLVVYVSRKVPRNRLKKGEVLPRRIEGTLVDVVEPYLLKIGMVIRTSSGRRVSDAAYRHLGLAVQQKLF